MITKPTIYTEENVTTQVGYILDIILENKDILYLGEVFENLPYSMQRFSEWSETFKENEQISETIKRIKSILESRVNVAGLKNKANATMVIFNLKNNYGWKDKTETDVTSGGEKITFGIAETIAKKNDITITETE
jgi:hypothetical protein